METRHKIINGDSRNMEAIPDASVHLVVTSPPYWQLKDYGTTDQIGFHDSYENYINHLNLVWKECHRTLHNGCRLCINVGDQFARAVYYGRYKVIPIREEIIKFCENIGFDYMGAVIWQKVTTSNTSGGGVQMGSYPYPRNGILKLDYEFILIFKKPGESPKPTKEQKELSILTPTEWNNYFAGHWNFAGARQNSHIAMFPEELPHRLIKMFSFVGETVLDPFAGSGTTSLAAINNQRNSLAYEINPEYLPIISDKLKAKPNTLIEFATAKKAIIDFESEINKLPYIFKDPHAFDSKIDLKKKQFGSKLDANSADKKIEFFSVKQVVNCNTLIFSNNQEIKLIGIKPNPVFESEAIEYLKNITKGKRVFIKFENQSLEENIQKEVYLYLENKTFINAHLIKTGFVNIDEVKDYKNKSKFKELYNNSIKK